MIFLFYNFIFLKFRNKHNLEKSTIPIAESLDTCPFSLSKMILYSSAYGENQNTTFQQSSWILNLLQYTDMAIYIDHNAKELTAENTIKKLTIDHISISTPKLGTPSLYYLSSLNFGTPDFNDTNKIEESIEFTILNDKNTENLLQYNTPTFFTDCSNPITLKYVNHSIKNNYQITSNEPVFFNGKLLEMAKIPLENLNSTIAFTIHIISNNNNAYFYQLSLPIPLENENNSILEGSIFMEKTLENSKFFKEDAEAVNEE